MSDVFKYGLRDDRFGLQFHQRKQNDNVNFYKINDKLNANLFAHASINFGLSGKNNINRDKLRCFQNVKVSFLKVPYMYLARVPYNEL